MFDRLRRWIGRRVLEIGSGIGNLSAFLVERERVVLTDTREEYLSRLRARFAGRPNIAVARLYLPNEHNLGVGERFDTVICLNVLEHVADHSGSLAAIRMLLAPSGRLVLLVPALPALFITAVIPAPVCSSCCARPDFASRISSTSTSPGFQAGGGPAGSCGARRSPLARSSCTTRSCRCSGWSASSRGASGNR